MNVMMGVDVADGQIPISCLLTSASLHDSQVAIPLASLSAERSTNLYDLMDAAMMRGTFGHTAARSATFRSLTSTRAATQR